MIGQLPGWAEEMRDLFRSGSVSQFLIHGNIFDVVGIEHSAGRRLLSLKAFLKDVMFESYDVVLEYDRGRGIRLTKGAEDWGDWLQQVLGNEVSTLQTREPGTALERHGIDERAAIRTSDDRGTELFGRRTRECRERRGREAIEMMPVGTDRDRLDGNRALRREHHRRGDPSDDARRRGKHGTHRRRRFAGKRNERQRYGDAERPPSHQSAFTNQEHASSSA